MHELLLAIQDHGLVSSFHEHKAIEIHRQYNDDPVEEFSQFLDQTVKLKKHPVAFESQKLTLVEVNYEIHNKELLALVFCFQKWCLYLFSVSSTLKVLTDHNSLNYFMTKKVLTCQQAHWAKFLAK